MSEDSFSVKTPILSFGFTRKEHILEIKPDALYMIRTWSWRRIGFIYKILQVKDGELIVRVFRK